MFNLTNIPKHRSWALISLLCPILAAAVTWLMTNSHTEFWNEVNKDLQDDANRNAGAIMAVAEVIQILFYMALGFACGLFFSVLSLVSQRSKFGFFCLLLNVAPLLLLVASIVYKASP